ncbi:hypothetical protein ACFLV4_03295 [Chloroflexota bacterium]
MNTKLNTKLLVIILVLVIAIPIIPVGCQEQEELPVTSPATKALSSTLVPNMELDVYIYIKQDNPTTLPAAIINAPLDVDVESLAIWGVHAEGDLTFGAGLTLTSNSDAAKVYTQIPSSEVIWTALSGNTIYAVQGSGTAAELLKAVISNHDFKYYDDSEALKALAKLPTGSTTKLAGLVVAKPSKELISYITKDSDTESLRMVNMILNMAGLEVIAGGLYSPRQIDVAEIADAMKSNGSILNLDLGILILAKSGLPGFVMEPIVKKVLTESEFTERILGEFTLYQLSLATDGGQAVPVLVRIEGNHVFAAISGQESYTETLITGVNQ